MLSNGAYASSETTGTDLSNSENPTTEMIQEVDNEPVAENYSSPSSDDTENMEMEPVAENYSSPLNNNTNNINMKHSSAPLRRK